MLHCTFRSDVCECECDRYGTRRETHIFRHPFTRVRSRLYAKRPLTRAERLEARETELRRALLEWCDVALHSPHFVLHG
jgi:hypothetical protein